jgi:hypothetical protein
MSFASVYPHYITKVEKKGRTKAELHQVIEWLTGYNENAIEKINSEKMNFETFFQKQKCIRMHTLLLVSFVDIELRRLKTF